MSENVLQFPARARRAQPRSSAQLAADIDSLSPRERVEMADRVRALADQTETGDKLRALADCISEWPPEREPEEHDRQRRNMQTFLFRSYDLIFEADEADLIRDVGLDLHKAKLKLRKTQERLLSVRKRVEILAAVEAKLSAAIVAATLSKVKK